MPQSRFKSTTIVLENSTVTNAFIHHLVSSLRRKPNKCSSVISWFHTLLSQFPFASKFGSAPLACSFFAVGSHMYHKNSQENQTSYILNLLFLSLWSWPNSILCTVLQWFVQCWSSYTFECRYCILPIFTHHNTYMQWLTYNGCLINLKVKF